jgi:rSAM-partnered protein
MTDSYGMRIDQPRGDETPEWEVFCRETAAEPLRHVGSVSAPTEAVAHEQASSLFGGETHSLWLCPAASIARFTDRDLGAAYAEDAGGARE